MRSVESRFNMSQKYQRRDTRVIGKTNHHERPANPGVVMLTKAADQKVHEKCAMIAEALAQQAIKGNASSARLLVDLAEGADWVKDPETVEKVLDVVELWMKEPKCSEEIGEMPAALLTSPSDPACSTYVN